jgi:hypothetical protein
MLLRNKYDLKKPRDFTVSEGHRYPLVLYNESKHNILALVGKTNKLITFIDRWDALPI